MASPNVNLKALTKEEIATFVGKIGAQYTQYEELFLTNNIDGTILFGLDDTGMVAMFNDLGITNGIHQWKLREKLQDLRLTGSAAGATVKATTVKSPSPRGSFTNASVTKVPPPPPSNKNPPPPPPMHLRPTSPAGNRAASPGKFHYHSHSHPHSLLIKCNNISQISINN